MSQPYTYIPLETKIEIAKLFAEGKLAKDIAPLYGLRTTQVNSTVQAMRKRGMVIPYKRPYPGKPTSAKNWTAEETAEVIRLYEDGEKVKVIAEKFGVSRTTIYHKVADVRMLGGTVTRKRNLPTRRTLIPAANLSVSPKPQEPLYLDKKLRNRNMKTFNAVLKDRETIDIKDITLKTYLRATAIRLLEWVIRL